MTLRRVKLVADAREQAQELGLPVSFMQDDARWGQEVDDNGEVVVDGRDYHLLHYHGLVERAELDSPAADQPDAEREADVSRTQTKDRGLSGTTSAVVGGVGHQADDGYSNAERVQGEIRRDQERGAAQQKERGLPSAKAGELDQNLRHEGRLPKGGVDRGKRPAVSQDRDESERASKELTKDAEKAEKAQDREAKAAEREQDKEQREDKAKVRAPKAKER